MTDQQAVSDMLMSYFMKGDIKVTQCSKAQAAKYHAEVVRHQDRILSHLDSLAYHIVEEHIWTK